MNKSIRFVVSSFALIGILTLSLPANALAAVSVWWPVDNATVSGTQPFKALVDEKPVDAYNMFWQVDNGQLNSMPTNLSDYPHKETSVDLSGWNWNSGGTYNVKFLAKDSNGNSLGEKSVVIKIPQSGKPNVEAAPAASQSAPVVEQSAPITPSLVVAPPVEVESAAALSTEQVKQLSIWWPADGSQLSGTQPFKARVEGLGLNAYTMYWQVDGGQLNRMYNNYVDGAHKESQVSLNSWNWKGAGPYSVNFVAKDSRDRVIAEKAVKISTGTITAPTSSIGTTNTTTSPVVTTTPVTVTPTPTPTPVPTPSVPVENVTVSNGSPISGLSLYVDPNNPARSQANAWRNSEPYNASLMDKIANQPSAKWIGNWNSNIYADTKSYVDGAANAGKVPVLIAYNIPGRDCGGYSAGNTSVESYKSWIQNVANAIGNRKTVVILEPDSLALISCLSGAELESRYSLLNFALSTLKSNANTIVYLDSGHSNWNPTNVMAERLNKGGIAKADGFALNVSNFIWTQDLVNYGNSLSGMVGGKHFVIDTSRNGLGPNGSEWCNPAGRALGSKPTTNTGEKLVDAFLWLKTPGESDGNCNGGPSAGVWWPSYAIGLAERATW